VGWGLFAINIAEEERRGGLGSTDESQ